MSRVWEISEKDVVSQKVGYLFAGQGAQYPGMGKDLSGSFPQSKKVFDIADEVLGFPLSKLCFEGPLEELTKTQNCQPAILAASIAAWEAFKTIHSAEPESYAAGLSLGEYSALVAAGAISLQDAVYLVRKRGEFMEEEALKSPGSMASLIGLDLAAVEEVCGQANVEIANINCPGQIVVSGGKKEIEGAVKAAEEKGARRAVLLEVSGAFHSSFMKGAASRLALELEKIKIGAPRIAVVSNVTARPVSGPQEIKDNLIRQITASVLWEDSMRFILSRGISRFFEFGPGKVLKGLMRRIDEKAQVSNMEKSEDIRKEPNAF